MQPKNKNKQSPPPANKKAQPNQHRADNAQLSVVWWRKYNVPLLVILLITCIAYLPIFHNGFVNWDDDAYIYENRMIQSLDLKNLFSGYVVGNYHPLTMLVYAIEYKLFGLNPAGYHAVALLLHLLNTGLVFYVVYLLSNKYEVAIVASLLFGVHPFHVESVAWTSELKDMLYVFFFLGSYFYYLKYLKDSQRKFYLIALLLFLLSLLSKAMAVSLPVALLLTDWFKGRKINTKVWLEKVPFFILAVIFGMVAITAQKSAEAINITVYSLAYRIIFASYGFIIYLVKLVLPLQLCSFYPYPIKSGEDMPSIYYIFPVLLMAFIAAVIYSTRSSRKTLFGIGFFTITILLVLQLVPVGSTIIADRYAYLPSIGIFYLAGEAFYYIWYNKKSAVKLAGSIILGIAMLLYSAKTYAQLGIWKDGMTFWNDVIKQYPTKVSGAYNSRAVLFLNDKKYEQAISDFAKAIEIKPDYSSAFNNRGALYYYLKKFPEARVDFDKAIALKPDYYEAYDNRGILSRSEKKFDEALADFNREIEINPNFPEAYNHRGSLFTMMNKNQEALADFNKALELNPGYAEAAKNRDRLMTNEKDDSEAMSGYNKAIAQNPSDYMNYYNRGILFRDRNNMDEAIRDLTKAIELNNKFFKAYYDRANIFMNEKKYDESLADLDKAIALQPDYSEAYNNKGIILSSQKKYDLAIKNFDKAIAYNGDNAGAYANRGIMLLEQQKNEEAVRDFSMVIKLHFNSPQAYYNRARAEFSLGRKEAGCKDLQQAITLKYQPAEDAFNHLCH